MSGWPGGRRVEVEGLVTCCLALASLAVSLSSPACPILVPPGGSASAEVRDQRPRETCERPYPRLGSLPWGETFALRERERERAKEIDIYGER